VVEAVVNQGSRASQRATMNLAVVLKCGPLAPDQRSCALLLSRCVSRPTSSCSGPSYEHRSDAASAPFHYALAASATRRRAAAELRR
jgi:hypothetical protein